MKYLATLSLIVMAATVGSTAHADPVTPQQRARASALVAQYGEVVQFCEPCGQVVPDAPKRAAAGETLVIADRENLDFIYVRTEPTHFYNLGALARGATGSAIPR